MNTLSNALEDYLNIRRGLGFKLQEHGPVLAKFVSFLEKQNASYITTELAVAWAMQPKNVQPAHWARRLCMVRGFAEYLSATDPRTDIPSHEVLPYNYRRKAPYIYTDKEIISLIKATRQLPSIIRSAQGLRARTFSTFFGLLAVTGMRVKEALTLNRDDVDLANGILTIHGSKFGKSRLVPVHKSTQRVLKNYTCQRERIYQTPKTQRFFLSERGTCLSYDAVRYTFVQLSRKIGLRGPADNYGPRIHDLRHRFAVNTLLRWYRKGINVEQHIPELATYLGHVKVSNTYWYLSAVPELLRLAALRLDHTKGGL